MVLNRTETARLAYLQKTCRTQVQCSTPERKLGINSCVLVIKTGSPRVPQGMTRLDAVAPIVNRASAPPGQCSWLAHKAIPQVARSGGTRRLLLLSQGRPNEQAWLTAAHGAKAGRPPRPEGRLLSQGPAHRPLPKPSPTSSQASPHDPRSPKPADSAARLPRALPSPASHSTGPGLAAVPTPPSAPAPHLRGERSHGQGGASPHPAFRRLRRALGETPADQNGPGRPGAASWPRRGGQRRPPGPDGAGRQRMVAGTRRHPPTHRCSKMAEKEEAGRPRGIMGGPWARCGARRPARDRETWRPSRDPPRARPGGPHWPRAARRTSGATPLPGFLWQPERFATRRGYGRAGGPKRLRPRRRPRSREPGEGGRPPRPAERPPQPREGTGQRRAGSPAGGRPSKPPTHRQNAREERPAFWQGQPPRPVRSRAGKAKVCGAGGCAKRGVLLPPSFTFEGERGSRDRNSKGRAPHGGAEAPAEAEPVTPSVPIAGVLPGRASWAARFLQNRCSIPRGSEPSPVLLIGPDLSASVNRLRMTLQPFPSAAGALSAPSRLINFDYLQWAIANKRCFSGRTLRTDYHVALKRNSQPQLVLDWKTRLHNFLYIHKEQVFKKFLFKSVFTYSTVTIDTEESSF